MRKATKDVKNGTENIWVLCSVYSQKQSWTEGAEGPELTMPDGFYREGEFILNFMSALR